VDPAVVEADEIAGLEVEMGRDLVAAVDFPVEAETLGGSVVVDDSVVREVVDYVVPEEVVDPVVPEVVVDPMGQEDAVDLVQKVDSGTLGVFDS
jgi:hypothetical protein